MTYQPIIDHLATARMLFSYNHEASEATMEIVENAVDQKADKRDQENSLLSEIQILKQKEFRIYLHDQLKPIDGSPEHASPPNLVNILQSEGYQKADEQEKKKLAKEQLEQNANEIRKLLFWVYSGIDMGKGNSNTEFSAYSQELVTLYHNR